MKAKGFATIALFLLAIGQIAWLQPVFANSFADEGSEFNVFLPMVEKPSVVPYYGLALAVDNPDDLTLLNATWYYNWSDLGTTNKAEYVPMAYSGKTSRLDASYNGYLLVFNEPNLGAPNGCGLSPQEAATRYIQLRRDLPNAKLVVGGWSVFAKDWARSFVEELKARNEPLPERWHVHAYTEEWITPAKAQGFLRDFYKLTGGTYWITEYGSPAGKLADFQSMTNWFNDQPWIERVAAYTNRQPDSAPWAIGSGVELVNDDSSLTAIGAFFSAQARVKAGK